MKKLILLLLLGAQTGYSQSKLITDTIKKIDFKEDTVQSVFNWVTDNIEYDLNKYNQIKKRGGIAKNTKFKSEAEYKEYLLTRVIKKEKGVCEDYALLFDSIVKELGYESYIVTGYTKNNEGKVSSLGHAWNAVKVNGKWRLYDPTWGAGYVEDGRKFVRRYNAEWYDSNPDFMIKTHMPYDPLWQMLNTPLNYKDFDSNKESSASGNEFDYETLITEFVSKDEKTQMQDQVSRSSALTGGSRMIYDWRKRMSKSVGVYGYVSNQELISEANDESNKAVELYNDYIAAKNKQFKGKKMVS